jgi:hypothetical protein
MSKRPRAIFCTWDGEVFRPKPAFAAYLAREYVVGEVYSMAPEEERDMNSHRHYFAALHQGFMNLSEENAKRFPTDEHLRHWALIQCGYCTETDFPAPNMREARRIAINLRKRSPYAIIVPQHDVVKVLDAESQSVAAMKKERFQQSKWDVLDLVAGMARTTRAQLWKNAGRSA